jgi:hypothetical protein
MDITPEVIAFAGMAACGLGMAWALFKPRGSNGLACWSVLYLDDNAVMQRSSIRVFAVWPVERRLTAWCSAQGREQVFRVSKIVEARDLSTGVPVDVDRWIGSFGVTAR